MPTLSILAVVILAPIAGYVQWLYAKANYPSSWQWKTALFFSGFGLCAIGASLLPLSDRTVLEKVLLVLGAGIFGGYGSLALFPQKMQTIMPKKG